MRLTRAVCCAPCPPRRNILANFSIEDVSDATRNLLLDHANSNPFQKHYLGRQIAIDALAIVRGLEPQNALVEMSCSIGHSISKRRPVDLTAEQAASINSDPHIKRLSRHIETLRQQAKHSRKAMDEYKEASRGFRSEKQSMRRSLKQQIRDEWTDKQAVLDIEAQLSGLSFADVPPVEVSNCPRRPAQIRLMSALTSPVETTIEGQNRRRDTAINAVMAYCVVVEEPVVRRRGCSGAGGTQPSPIKDDPPVHSRWSVAAASTFIKSEKRPRCFLCVGEAFPLEPEDPRNITLFNQFYSPGDLTKHFKRMHLSNLQEGEEIYCRVCEMQLDDKTHLQNHAHGIHGTKS